MDCSAEMKRTPSEHGKSYWGNDGAYTKELDDAWAKLVPSSGEAETLHGELVRAFGRLNYEFGNNGNCNAVDVIQDTCSECYGSGYEEEECDSCGGMGHYVEEEGDECHECDGSGTRMEDCQWCGGECYVGGDKEITGHYQALIDFIRDTFIKYNHATESIDLLEKFLLREDIGYSTYTFDNNEMEIYNYVGDMVGYVITTTEDEPREKSGIYN